MISRLSLLVLIISFTSSVYTSDCPYPEDIAPCTCTEDDNLIISCYEGTLGNMKDPFFKNLREEKNLVFEFADLNLGVIPPAFFHGLHVKTLEFSHCKIKNLTTDNSQPQFMGLEDSLEELIIFGSIDEDSAQKYVNLAHLQHLKELELAHNSIRHLGNQWFERGPVNLQILHLSNSNIRVLGDKAFSSLHLLRTLWLDGNNFEAIQRSMLPRPATHLVNLELSNNGFSNLPEDLFVDMPVLTSVSLQNNAIQVLPSSTWKPVWSQLKVLDLYGCPLNCEDTNIDWMSNQSGPYIIKGRCASPSESRGKSFHEIIKQRT